MYIIRCLFVALLVAMASARNHKQNEKRDMCHCNYLTPAGQFGFLGTGKNCPPYAEECGLMGNNICCYTLY